MSFSADLAIKLANFTLSHSPSPTFLGGPKQSLKHGNGWAGWAEVQIKELSMTFCVKQLGRPTEVLRALAHSALT